MLCFTSSVLCTDIIYRLSDKSYISTKVFILKKKPILDDFISNTLQYRNKLVIDTREKLRFRAGGLPAKILSKWGYEYKVLNDNNPISDFDGILFNQKIDPNNPPIFLIDSLEKFEKLIIKVDNMRVIPKSGNDPTTTLERVSCIDTNITTSKRCKE